MASIPSNIARVPNLLASQVLLSGLTRTSTQLLKTQVQLATGQRINRPSDDSVGASAVSVLDRILERRDQRLRNLSHADAVLTNLDQAISDATEIVQEARTIGHSQIGIISDEETRASQAGVIDAMINELFSIGNRQFQDLYLFGGERTAASPFHRLHNGVQYQGVGDGLVTDLGTVSAFPITMSGEDAFGALSNRVEGDHDLDPTMSADTRLRDLFGAQGSGIQTGTIQVDVNGSVYELDLATADTIGDVAAMIEAALSANEPGALGPGGVTIDAATGNRINIDLNAGYVVTFSDLAGAGGTAADLGLSQNAFEDGVNETGADVNPMLTDLTPLSALAGVSVPPGTIRISNAGQMRELDLSSVTTVAELKNAVDSLRIGVRVEIAESRDRLNFINELSGGSMSIAEVGGGLTATELGVRSLAATTKLADFNDGRGVNILSGNVDPETGLPDPTRDLDFRVTLKDGRFFDIDLAGATTVQDVLDMINTTASGAGVTVPIEFTATLVSDGNGIELVDNTSGTTLSVTPLNGSLAAHDLGIAGSTTGASMIGEDRATVAVDSVFAHMISLRDALLADDERGIEFATQRLESDITRLAGARAESGVRGQRVVRLTNREEELKVQDMSLRSQIRDLDFAEAAMRFANLQTQLQAALATTSQALSLSLIDFLTPNT